MILILNFTLKNSTYYFDNYSIQLVNYYDIDLVFFGDSHSEYGFNNTLISKLFNNNTRNISLSGNTLYNNILILEKVLSFNPNIIVNLSIGNHNVGESYFLNGNDVDQEIKRWFTYYNPSEIMYLFQNYPKQFFTGFFGIISTIGIESFGFSEGESRMDLLKGNKIKFKKKENDYINTDPMWLHKLTNLIKKYPNTKFRIIRVPIHNQVFFEEEFYLTIIKYMTHFDNVEFQDYQNLKLDDKDFRDFTHLSKSGAEKLSKEYHRRNLIRDFISK